MPYRIFIFWNKFLNLHSYIFHVVNVNWLCFRLVGLRRSSPSIVGPPLNIPAISSTEWMERGYPTERLILSEVRSESHVRRAKYRAWAMEFSSTWSTVLVTTWNQDLFCQHQELQPSIKSWGSGLLCLVFQNAKFFWANYWLLCQWKCENCKIEDPWKFFESF